MSREASGLDQKIHAELVRLQFRQTRAIALGSGVALIFVLLWFSSVYTSAAEYIWLVGLLFVRLFAFLLPIGFSELDLEAKIRRGHAFVLQSFVGGCCWAYGAWITLASHDEAQRVIFVAVFCGLCATVATTQVAIRWSAPAFTLPPMLVLVYFQIEHGGPKAPIMILLAVFFLIALTLLHRGQFHELVSGLKSREELEQSRQQLEEQSRQLSALLQLKEFFIAAASHDLRQPAQAVQLLARSVHESTRAVDTLHERSGALLAAADQVTDLINRLLDLARLDLSGDRAKPVWHSLHSVGNQIEPLLKPRAKQYDVSLEIKLPDIEVFADPLFLARTLQNLLINAIEHSKGERVWLEVNVPHDTSLPIRLYVRDNGVGVDSAAARLLESPDQPLYIDSATPSVRGLGLAIAARLAYLDGHRLSISSEAGVGTTVEIVIAKWRHGEHSQADAERQSGGTTELPARTVGSDCPDSELVNRSAPGQRTTEQSPILIVEDDPLVRLGLSAMLEGAGYRCDMWFPDTSRSELLERTAPALIIADWQLDDGTTAIDVVPKIQQALPAPLPVIILTGLARLPIATEGLPALLGNVPVRILQKPVDDMTLRRTISDLRGLEPPNPPFARTAKARKGPTQ